MNSLSEADYNDEKMRLSGGVIRLALPNRIITELDSFAEIFLIVGSVMDFSSNAVHQAPTKLPNSIKAVKVKTGRTKSVDEDGKILYPDYAVLFLVPYEGVTVEEVKQGPSNTNLSPDEHSPFRAVNQFRASIVGRSRMDHINKPVKSKVNLLTASMSKLLPSHSASSVSPASEPVPPPSEEDEAVTAYAKAQKPQRQRMSISAGAGGVPTGLPEQTVRVRAAGFRRSAVTGPTNLTLLQTLSPTGTALQFAPTNAPETRHHHHRASDVNAPIGMLADKKSDPLLSPSSDHLL
ncbi:hypothetical protein RvY_13439 [Ramazzottius varieornatus]|uniref:Uncharacterized protein n=1 Tax=Ramazzottius varieornatus TaxID=947166 RepID=A0A1D1VMW4_RAMVA|nr:hypothetical protein RvY_13439 [Ramazzottius varieornatus]